MRVSKAVSSGLGLLTLLLAAAMWRVIAQVPVAVAQSKATEQPPKADNPFEPTPTDRVNAATKEQQAPSDPVSSPLTTSPTLLPSSTSPPTEASPPAAVKARRVQATGQATSRASDPFAEVAIANGTPVRVTKVFALRNSPAADLREVLAPLFARIAVAADARSNSLIVSGAVQDVAEVEALVIRLDDAKTAAVPPRYAKTSSGGLGGLGGLPGAATATTSGAAVPAVRTNSYTTFLDVTNEASPTSRKDQESFVFVKQLKAAEKAGNESEVSGLRGKLANVLREIFELRQTQRRDEVATLKKRLAEIEKSVQAREEAKEQIIERRMNELLLSDDPNLQWNPHASVETAFPVASKFLAPVATTAPSGLARAIAPARSPSVSAAAPVAPTEAVALPASPSAAAPVARAATLATEETVTRVYDATSLGPQHPSWLAAQAARQAERAMAELDLREAEIKLTASRNSYDRASKLGQSGGISAGEIDQLRTAVELAEIAMQRARVSLESLQNPPNAKPSTPASKSAPVEKPADAKTADPSPGTSPK